MTDRFTIISLGTVWLGAAFKAVHLAPISL